MKKQPRLCLLCRVYFPTETAFQKHLKKCEIMFLNRESIEVCPECDEFLEPITEKNGKKSKYSFYCKSHPDRIVSIG
jgi:hypothetical protein